MFLSYLHGSIKLWILHRREYLCCAKGETMTAGSEIRWIGPGWAVWVRLSWLRPRCPHLPHWWHQPWAIFTWTGQSWSDLTKQIEPGLNVLCWPCTSFQGREPYIYAKTLSPYPAECISAMFGAVLWVWPLSVYESSATQPCAVVLYNVENYFKIYICLS